jgi:hypothetical protein
MNSNSAKTFTRGKWAVLFLALLIVPEFAFAQTSKKPTQTPPPKPAPTKTTPPKSAPAPAQPPATQQKPVTGQTPKPNPGPTTNQQRKQTKQNTVPPDQKNQVVKKDRTDEQKNKVKVLKDEKDNRDDRDPPRNSESVVSRERVISKPDGHGGTSNRTSNGVDYHVGRNGNVDSVSFKSSKGYDTKVNRSVNGSRTVVSEHVNPRGEHITMVNTGPNRGYVDHTFTRNGRPYLRRTYVAGGKSYAVVYRGYYFGGRPYFAYVPGYYYAPGFYGWAYAPFAAPVAFAWGWGGAPWYGYYGYYFAPYPAYEAPAFWLTDYVVAENLQAAYESHGAEVTTSNNQQEGAGLAYAPVLSAGASGLAPGFSAGGNSSVASDRLVLGAGGTATFTFSVPAGQVETVAYRIPTGGYLDSVPFEVSVNGVTVATVDKDPNYKWGDIAPIQRQLWSKSFDPGDYVLTIRSGGGFVNFYGLWLGRAPSDQAPMTGNDGNQSASVTPEIKTAITDEVKADLASEQAVSTAPPTQSGASPTSDVPAALDPKQRTFVVSTAISEKTTDGSQCSLSAGDILTRIDNTPDTNQNVTSMVTSSQKSDCPSGTMVAISIQDLQDMHNAFVEKMDAGLKQLASTQGTKGIPSSPAPGQRPNPDGQAQPDTTASSDLQQQQKDADSAEKDVNQAVAPGQGN